MKNLILVSWLFLTSAAALAAEVPVAIIGALSEEIQSLDSRLDEKQVFSYLGINFFKGRLNGRMVVLVKSGMGKVNAAMTTAVLLERFQPSAVIFTGIAGGLDPALHPGDIVISSQLIQHDYGTIDQEGMRTEATENPLSEQKNPLGFCASPQLVTLAQQASGKAKLEPFKAGVKPQVMVGIIVTGDTFVASSAKGNLLRKEFKALAVEMEGAAVAQVCFQQKCPFVVVRSISDRADAGAEFDFQRFCRVACGNSSRIVEELVKLLPAQ